LGEDWGCGSDWGGVFQRQSFGLAAVMAKGDHGFSVHVRGSLNGGYLRPRVQIGFDEATLRAIRKLARKNDRSFAAEVRVLLAEALVRRGD
jgi:hypothetical protein